MATEAQAPTEAVGRSEAGGKSISVGLLLVMAALLLRVAREGRAAIAGGALGIPTLILGLALVLFVANLFIRPQQCSIRFDAPLKILIVFLGWQMITLLWARWPERAVPSMMSYIVFVLGVYFLVLAYTGDEHDLDRWAMLYSIIALFTLALTWRDRSFGWEQVGEATGLQYIGRYARRTIEALPFTLHLALWGRDRGQRALGAGGLLAGLTTIFWTTRRVAIAALLLIGLIYGWLIARRQRRHLLILVAALAVMVALVLTNKSYMFRIRQIVELDILYSGDSPRIIVWTAGLDALREHWLLGMGAYNFPTWIHRVWGWPAEFEQHNLTLQLLTEVGLPGLLIFGAFVVAVLIRVRAGLRAALAHGGLRDASMLAAALSSFAAMLLYAQAQPFLLDTLIFVPAALCSVGAELALRRFPAEPAADGTPVEPVDVYE
jgi:hypothetical protein